MKYIFYFILIASIDCKSQTIDFSYDASGNRLTKQILGTKPIATVTGDTLACQGDIVTYTASGGTSYAWSNGATDSVMHALADTSTTFIVGVSNTFGCHDTAAVRLHVFSVAASGPIVGPSLIALTSVPRYDTFTAPSHIGSVYHWSATNGSVVSGTGSNQVVIEFTTPGTGYISVYESLYGDSCSSMPYDYAITVVEASVVTSVSEGESRFNVYPNPSQGSLWVDFESTRNAPVKLSVVNMLGSVIYQNVYPEESQYHIPVAADIFPVPGFYTIQLITQSGTLSKKITVLK
ncbi:MAG: T9SS type A sorting domain-containing protein [Taibaiella sp.]|nr:T9SS type A sorting domain-containing protein [Taibaiella sp.]